MHTDAHCRRLAAWLATQGLRASVAVHLPKATKADLVIWPYLTSTPAGMRNAQPTQDGEGRLVRPVIPVQTHALLLPASLAAHDRAMALLRDNPILTGSPPLRLLIESPPLADLSALFVAAQARYQLAIPLMIA